MATGKKNFFEREVKSFLPNETIHEMARETGFMQRQGKIKMSDFFWNQVLGFDSGTHRSINQFRISYEAKTGTTLSRSSFYERFDDELVVFLKKVLKHLCKCNMKGRGKLKKKLKRFQELVISDTTVIKLHDLLEKVFPSVRKGKGRGKVKSSAKIHYSTGINDIAPSSVVVTSETVRDITKLKIDKGIRNKLLLFDRAYYGYKVFQKISQNKGYFISRIKEPNKFIITKDNLAGDMKDDEDSPVGMTLNEALYWLRRDVFDVEVTLGINTQSKSRGQIPRKRLLKFLKTGNVPPHIKIFRLRVVCIWNSKKGRYDRYITNILDPEELNAHDIAEVYSYRWEVEMIFKELKSYYHIDELSTRKKCVVEALIYSALISLVVCRMLLYGLSQYFGVSQSDIPRRLFTAFFAYASRIIHVLISVNSLKEIWQNLETALLHNVIEPYSKRRDARRERMY